MSESRLQTAISGSFKFKPEIDELIDQCADMGVDVLEPTKGWLWTPGMDVAPSSFRPLPAERGIGIAQVENRFLRAITKADFLYVYTQGQYVGASTCLEVGFALGIEKPIYTSEPIAHVLAEGDLEHLIYLENRLVVAGIAEAVRMERSRQPDPKGRTF